MGAFGEGYRRRCELNAPNRTEGLSDGNGLVDRAIERKAYGTLPEEHQEYTSDTGVHRGETQNGQFRVLLRRYDGYPLTLYQISLE